MTALRQSWKKSSMMGSVTYFINICPCGHNSGLMEKCVLSNVSSSINGNNVFGVENKIIEKKIKSAAGTDITVKVGIIGETTPGLSTRTEGYKSKLVAEDILENAKKQAETLKAQGADITSLF